MTPKNIQTGFMGNDLTSFLPHDQHFECFHVHSTRKRKYPTDNRFCKRFFLLFPKNFMLVSGAKESSMLLRKQIKVSRLLIFDTRAYFARLEVSGLPETRKNETRTRTQRILPFIRFHNKKTKNMRRFWLTLNFRIF